MNRSPILLPFDFSHVHQIVEHITAPAEKTPAKSKRPAKKKPSKKKA